MGGGDPQVAPETLLPTVGPFDTTSLFRFLMPLAALSRIVQGSARALLSLALGMTLLGKVATAAESASGASLPVAPKAASTPHQHKSQTTHKARTASQPKKRAQASSQATAVARQGAAKVTGKAKPLTVALNPPSPEPDDRLITDARDAFGKGDRTRLQALRATAVATAHPLALWADYWDLNLRLNTATSSDVRAFFERWPGSYVEDRLRNDWLLETGRRRDWSAFEAEQARFRMNDDRQVHCYRLLSELERGVSNPARLAESARPLWLAQRDPDDGCHNLAGSLLLAGAFQEEAVWTKLRLATEQARSRTVRAAALLLDTRTQKAIDQLIDRPTRYLEQENLRSTENRRALAVLAVLWLANDDPVAAARHLAEGWSQSLPTGLAAVAWIGVARQAAFKRLPEAAGYVRQALALRAMAPINLGDDWSDDTLGWAVRGALRAGEAEGPAWPLVRQSIEAMSPSGRQDPTWRYWYARALQATAPSGAEGEAQRQDARQRLSQLASPLHFYGQLAAEELGEKPPLPMAPAELTAAERQEASRHPGFQRALRMLAIGLRSEGTREWNFSRIGLSDRQLLAAAQMACDLQRWDLCINTSERTQAEIRVEQRYPQPFRDDILQAAKSVQLDPALMFGLIRQESRFLLDARSQVGASGLMQIMPATAKWTARKIGLNFSQEQITQQEVNLKLGAAYLKLVLDDFNGSAAMATAAYNAGPSRPRRWREGSRMEAAAWAESIPFSETRDYVKKVLSNASVYAALLQPGAPVALKHRLGPAIGPRTNTEPDPNSELP
jgi:soluble lytic murein transglycosylase